MSEDQLGLFDTPPTRKQMRLSVAIVGLLFLMLVVTSAVRDIPLGQIEPFIPMVDSSTTLIDLIIATLLYVQAGVFRSRALTALASGYVFTALILIPHALTFPGAFTPDGLLGAGRSTTAWLYMFWRAALPVSVILYVILDRSDVRAQPGPERRSPRIAAGVLAAIGLAVAVTILTTTGHDLLPVLYRDRTHSNYANMIMVSSIVGVLFTVAIALLWRKRRSVLDIWLLVVLAAWLVQTLLLQALQGRFTVSWYFAVLVVLLSHLFLMLALIAESSRLYARLALSTAARNRERDTRLMSMDAVAAAISHEVGQPLTAVTMNALAGLNWLSRAQPDVERAKESMRATIDAGHRTSDVIHSIRAMFRKGRTTATSFGLNDLVRETALLLDRELAAENVALMLALDETLPPIQADRVQLQRVLVNLLANAIEAIRVTHGRPRNILISSTSLDGQEALLEVTDNGVGMAPREMENIFQPFFTSKATGTGLGLFVCRQQ
ncbi:MAG: hypothetical protein EOP21_03085 [Hyphomicrobiales bacterium]|nr:MAG: hypothetical protein EOP21_03085 [Hyphomicrobiales bacterium]